jgi:hypothetical protein
MADTRSAVPTHLTSIKRLKTPDGIAAIMVTITRAPVDFKESILFDNSF